MADKIRVRMITLMAGPEGVNEAGSELVLAKNEALALIRGGYAEAVKLSGVEQAVEAGFEVSAQTFDESTTYRTEDFSPEKSSLSAIVGEDYLEYLVTLGIRTIEDLREVDEDILTGIKGVGPVTAKKWKDEVA